MNKLILAAALMISASASADVLNYGADLSMRPIIVWIGGKRVVMFPQPAAYTPGAHAEPKILPVCPDMGDVQNPVVITNIIQDETGWCVEVQTATLSI